MELTFIGKDPESHPNECPSIYRTDRGTWVIQGWKVSDPDALARMDIPAHETAVEIPDRLVPLLVEAYGPDHP